MNIQVINKKLREVKADLEVVFVLGKNLKHKWVKDGELLKKLGFKGDQDEIALLIEKSRVYVGLDSLLADDLRIASASLARGLKTKQIKSLKLGVYSDKDEFVSTKAIAEGFLLGAYDFDFYKSKKEKTVFSKLIICNDAFRGSVDIKKVKRAVGEAKIVSDAVNFTRDIVNKTPEDITPLTMTKIAKGLCQSSDLKISVKAEKYLFDNGFGAFLAVSKASPYPPQLIHISYKPKTAKKKIALVGKGLTYDTGGLSLKPSEHMLTMKMDKAGGCAIFGVMKAIEALKLPIEVHGIVGAVENAIGQHAYKPDDVLAAKNKKTIEVKNTDAEGRLVLADCLCYAQELKTDFIIDIATLTGASLVALGEYTTAVMGYSEELKGKLNQSAKISGELVADLPFNRYLTKLLKSDIADIANLSSSPYGGAITAGLFLSEFIEEKNKDKWLHLDIAGPAYKEKPWGENPSGGSGAGVRLLTQFLKDIR